jgi:hypothetical protein
MSAIPSPLPSPFGAIDSIASGTPSPSPSGTVVLLIIVTVTLFPAVSDTTIVIVSPASGDGDSAQLHSPLIGTSVVQVEPDGIDIVTIVPGSADPVTGVFPTGEVMVGAIGGVVSMFTFNIGDAVLWLPDTSVSL